MTTPQLILNPVCWSYNTNPKGQWEACEHTLAIMNKLEVGDTYSVEVGAPGIGRYDYRVTHIDCAGVHGVLIADTVEVLTPAQTE